MTHITRETRRLIPFKTEVEIVLILPGLFLREIIISSTSAEDTVAKNNELANYLLDIGSDHRVLHSLTQIYAHLCLQSMNCVHL